MDEKEFIEYVSNVGETMSRHIMLYNNKFVFSKDMKYERPLDREKLGGSTQRNVLFYLKRVGEETMSKIAYDVNCDKGNLSKLVNDLVKKDFAKRTQKENDRRNVHVSLTDKGIALMNEESEMFIKNAEYTLKKLTDEEKRDFLEKYKGVTAYMEKL